MLPNSEAADSWSLGELLDAAILVASQFDNAFCWMWYKAPLFFSPFHFYVAHVTIPERFLARSGWCDRGYWLSKFIHHFFLCTSQIFKSLCCHTLPRLFSHFIFFLQIHPFYDWALALSCLSSLLLPPLLHSLITMSIMPACLMWWRRMVSITCNKRHGA